MANLLNPKILDEAFLAAKVQYNFVADEVATKVPVKTRGGQYLYFDRFSQKIENDLVGSSGTPEVEESFRGVQKKAFAIETRGFKARIKQQDIENLKDAELYDLIQEKASLIKLKILLAKEDRIKNIIEGASNFTTPGVKWNANESQIEKDIRDAIKAFKSNAGIAPNVIIIPEPVWNVMVIDPTLREVWKLVPGIAETSKIKLTSLIKLLFDNFEKVLVPNAQKDIAKKGLTPNLVDIWPNDVALLYVAEKGSDETFTAISRFILKDVYSRQWDEEDPQAKVIGYYYEEDVQLVCDNAIYLLKDVLS